MLATRTEDRVKTSTRWKVQRQEKGRRKRRMAPATNMTVWTKEARMTWHSRQVHDGVVKVVHEDTGGRIREQTNCR